MAKLLTMLFAIVGLMGALAFHRLPSGWMDPSFQTILTDTIGPVQLTLPEVQMRWGGWRHPLGINIRHVTIKKEGSDLTLKVPSLLFSLKMIPLLQGKAEIGRCSFDVAKVYLKDLLLGEVSGKAKKHHKKLSVHVKFQKLDLTALVHIFMEKDCHSSASFPLFGTLILEGNHKVGLTKLNLFCQSEGGNLVIPEIYPHPLRFDKTQFVLTGNGETLTLAKASLRRGNATLTVQGKLDSSVSWLNLYQDGGKVSLSLTGKGGDIPVDDLTLLWPQGLSPKPRQWVVQQLSKGQVDHVTTRMQGVMSVAPGGKVTHFEVPHIQGEIDARGVTVDYFGKLPPVVDVNGQCRFTRRQFMIDAVGVTNGVRLKTAKIVIYDTHLKDQTIDMALSLEGPVRNSLDVINSEPLFLAKKLDLDPTHISGQAITNLHLAFPLETEVPLELVNVHAKSQIKEGQILYDAQLEGKPVKLDQGTFDLEVSKKHLKMEGQGQIRGVEAFIQWQEYFGDKDIPFRRQFLLQGNLNLRKLKKFGINAAGYLDGEAKAHIQYTNNKDMTSMIEGVVDLTPTVMVSPILFWQKEKGEAGTLRVKMRKAPHRKMFFLDKATLVAPNLEMVAEGNKDDRFEIKHLKIDNNLLKSNFYVDKSGVIQATIRGERLDLSKLFDDSTSKPLLKPPSEDDEDQKEGRRIKANVSLDRVHLGKNNEIHEVRGEMFYRQNTLTWAHLKGKVSHNNAAISLSVTPLSNDRQQFMIKSDDGGHLLEILGAGYDVEGGHLVIKGIKKDEKKKDAEKKWDIEGTMSIDDFTINKAPLLARLLSAASLHGIVNFFSGKGIHFHNGTADFFLTSDHLNLKNVRLISPSLGLLLNGSIDRLHHKVNFTGELIPLYIVNAVLAQIPLVGHWISGGREDGVFLTQFTLTGGRGNPTLAINPMTGITPGLVREFLAAQGTKP